MEKKFWTTKEFAEATGYTRIWIAYLAKTGRIKAEMYGYNYLIPRDEAIKYLGKTKKELNSVFPRKYKTKT